MKQKMVIYVPMNDEKSGSKAMTLASKRKGVTKVEVLRDKNLLVVMGEDVDSVKLAESLRKKFCFANIVSVHNTIAQYSNMDEDDDDDDDHRPQIRYDSYQPPYNLGYPVYNPDPPPVCSIM